MIDCNNSAVLYAEGAGILINYDKVLSLLEKACNGGSGLSCNNFKDLYNKICINNPKKFCSKYK